MAERQIAGGLELQSELYFYLGTQKPLEDWIRQGHFYSSEWKGLLVFLMYSRLSIGS